MEPGPVTGADRGGEEAGRTTQERMPEQKNVQGAGGIGMEM